MSGNAHVRWLTEIVAQQNAVHEARQTVNHVEKSNRLPAAVQQAKQQLDAELQLLHKITNEQKPR